MISKRKMRPLRGRQKQVKQFNYDFSTSPDYNCVVTNYYDKDGNFTHSIMDDLYPNKEYDKDKVIKWYKETFAKRLA